MIRRVVVTLLAVLFTVAAHAQQAIPTPDEFLGYKLGAQFTPHHRILDYFRELDARSPLLTFEKYGETYEGRPLMLAIVTSEKNRADLDAVRADLAQLSGTRAGDSATVAAIAKKRPAVAWLAYGIHGNESSSAEAAMRVASNLLRDPEATRLLDDLIVIIDPLQNPDGRERYIEGFRRARGVNATSNPDAAEHYEAWPGGRYNHYMIDMNRDWAWTSQKESRARVNAFRQWNPQVFVDLHEMFYSSSYFFPPTAKPFNANLPKDVSRWLDVFGKGNAEAFSQKGWQFFVGERFDLFYPGYGDSWPSLGGAIGMTYEVAGHGRAGTSIEREDGTVLTLADRIDRHATSSMATLRTAAANREALLLYTASALRASEDGNRPTFFLSADAPNAQALVAMLGRQGIEVGVLRQPFTARAQKVGGEPTENRTFPAGTIVVTARQRYGALVQSLLERTPVLQQDFVEEQREKAEADQPDDFYDLTAWSLPLAMNVDAWSVNGAAPATTPWSASAPLPLHNAKYAYIVDGLDPAIYHLAGKLVASDVRFSVSEGDVDIAGRKFARGSILVFRGNNSGELDATLQRLLAESGANATAVDSGWTGGTALGSEKIHAVKKPRIALVGGAGTSSNSFGMLWHTLDVDTPIPHTVVTVDALRNIDLNRYDVILFPDGDYGDRVGKRGVERLQAWTRNGGTIVAVKGASGFLREKDVEISKLKPWEPAKKKDDDAAKTDERYNEFRIPGSIFRTRMNDSSYLTFGVPHSPAVLIEGTAAWQPVSHKVDNIITIEKKDALISGVAWPESLERIQGSVYVVSEPYGRGSVVTFADEPHFRLFWRGTLPVLMNALLYSPSFQR
jgi:hypothetical protein